MEQQVTLIRINVSGFLATPHTKQDIFGYLNTFGFLLCRVSYRGEGATGISPLERMIQCIVLAVGPPPPYVHLTST